MSNGIRQCFVAGTVPVPPASSSRVFYPMHKACAAGGRQSGVCLLPMCSRHSPCAACLEFSHVLSSAQSVCCRRAAERSLPATLGSVRALQALSSHRTAFFLGTILVWVGGFASDFVQKLAGDGWSRFAPFATRQRHGKR